MHLAFTPLLAADEWAIWLNDLLGQVSQWSTPFILVLLVLHLFGFVVLWFWARRDLRQIASSLFDFTKGLKNQSLLGSTMHLSDQIEAFLADVNDVLDDPTRQADRRSLLDRLNILDERRRYLHSMLFETTYNVARTMIEAYTLMGILGTIMAIGAALQVGTSEEATSVGVIVSRFGEAIWSTFAGLIAAMLLMFINSIVEPTFHRLGENRQHVRQTIARAKRELSIRSEQQQELHA